MQQMDNFVGQDPASLTVGQWAPDMVSARQDALLESYLGVLRNEVQTTKPLENGATFEYQRNLFYCAFFDLSQNGPTRGSFRLEKYNGALTFLIKVYINSIPKNKAQSFIYNHVLIFGLKCLKQGALYLYLGFKFWQSSRLFAKICHDFCPVIPSSNNQTAMEAYLLQHKCLYKTCSSK